MATLIGCLGDYSAGGCKGSSGGGSVQKTLRPLKTVGAKKPPWDRLEPYHVPIRVLAHFLSCTLHIFAILLSPSNN